MIELILNIFFPGVGTMINGCLGPRRGPGILYGFLQLLTAALLIGWVWSIIYGLRILEVSKKPKEVVVVAGGAP